MNQYNKYKFYKNIYFKKIYGSANSAISASEVHNLKSKDSVANTASSIKIDPLEDIFIKIFEKLKLNRELANEKQEKLIQQILQKENIKILDQEKQFILDYIFLDDNQKKEIFNYFNNNESISDSYKNLKILILILTYLVSVMNINIYKKENIDYYTKQKESLIEYMNFYKQQYNLILQKLNLN